MASGTIKAQSNLHCKVITKTLSVAANEIINTNIAFGEIINNIVGIAIQKHINPARVFGSVASYSSTGCTIGVYNSYNAEVSGDVIILVFYTV